VTPTEALQHIRALVEASAELKDDTHRKVLLRGVIVVAQKGLGVATGWCGRMCAQRPHVSHAVGGGPPPCSSVSEPHHKNRSRLGPTYGSKKGDIPSFKNRGFVGAPLSSQCEP
jgi:hypothetical protein